MIFFKRLFKSLVLAIMTFLMLSAFLMFAQLICYLITTYIPMAVYIILPAIIAFFSWFYYFEESKKDF